MSGPVSARVERVIDGDTFAVRAQIWLDQELLVAVRPKGVNAPELHGSCREEREAAKAARTFLASLLAQGDVLLSEIEEDKYSGRVDAIVTLPDGRDLSEILLSAGVAVPYDGGRRVAFCALQ